jgi:chaperonin cofactor prefoldin
MCIKYVIFMSKDRTITELQVIAQQTEVRLRRLEEQASCYQADIAVIKAKLNMIGYAAGASLVGIIGLIVGLISKVI